MGKQTTCVWFGFTFAAAMLGCGPGTDPHGRLPVSGSVTFQGQLLEKGSINFRSEESNAVLAGALIRGGKYNVPRDGGLTPGKYRVEISSLEDTPIPTGAPGENPAPPAKERIPEEFNTKSREFVDVKADQENKFDFTIK